MDLGMTKSAAEDDSVVLYAGQLDRLKAQEEAIDLNQASRQN